MAQSYGGYGQQSQQQPSGNMNYAASGTAPQQHSYGGYDTTTGYTGYQQSTQQSTGFQTANYQQPQQGPQTGGYSQGGYNQTQTGYNQNQGNYNQGNYNQAQGSYNQNQGGYNQGQSGYNQNQHGYGQGSQNNYNQSGGGSGGYSKSEGVGSYGNGGKGSDRGGYGGDRGGPRSGAGHFGNNVVKDGMLIQEDTIFVSGLPTSASTKEIAEFFGQIGVIKMDKRTHQPKIWIYKRPDGSSKGECTVTYEDTEASSAAVNWFNGKTFGSETIKVSIAERKAPAGGFGKKRGGGRGGGRDFGGGRGGGFGGGRGRGGGGDSRDGDWTCPKCNNNNFARRSECNRCGEQRSGTGNSGGGRDRGSRDSGRDRDRDRSDRRSRPY